MARCIVAEPADGEARTERKSSLHSGPRLVPRPKQRQRGGEHKMHDGIISVGLLYSPSLKRRWSILREGSTLLLSVPRTVRSISDQLLATNQSEMLAETFSRL